MPDLAIKTTLQEKGILLIAGIDEAGRGPLAGPVSAAAVILPAGYECPGLDDSKKISPANRDRLYDTITQDPHVRWAVATASHTEIDQLNILKATHLAMRRAVEQLDPAPHHCIIDGLPIKGLPIPHTGVIKGDSKSLSIAAASIIAKVTRDRIMQELDKEFPQYQFSRHQGYGTDIHIAAIRKYGTCKHHRMSIRLIQKILHDRQQPELF
jgi:ribonuclease HII